MVLLMLYALVCDQHWVKLNHLPPLMMEETLPLEAGDLLGAILWGHGSFGEVTTGAILLDLQGLVKVHRNPPHSLDNGGIA